MGYIVVVYGRRHQQPQYSFFFPFYILFATCSLTLGGAGRDNDGIKGPEIKKGPKSLFKSGRLLVGWCAGVITLSEHYSWDWEKIRVHWFSDDPVRWLLLAGALSIIKVSSTLWMQYPLKRIDIYVFNCDSVGSKMNSQPIFAWLCEKIEISFFFRCRVLWFPPCVCEGHKEKEKRKKVGLWYIKRYFLPFHRGDARHPAGFWQEPSERTNEKRRRKYRIGGDL